MVGEKFSIYLPLHRRKLLPIQWETVEISLRDAYKIRRVFRKLAKKRGTGSLR